MSEVRQSIPRISRVRLKSGADVRIPKFIKNEDRAACERDIRAVLDAHTKAGSDIAGYAFVVWAHDFASTTTSYSGPSSLVPALLIGDFVRNAIVADRIEGWTIDRINGT